MEFEIVHGAPEPEALAGLYHDAGWHSELQREDVARSISATSHWLQASNHGDGDELIGIVRLQTDFVFYCAVYDLIVDSRFRRNGVGSALMEATLAWAREVGVRQVHLWPVAGLAPFYERFGFEALEPDQPLMRIIRDGAGAE